MSIPVVGKDGQTIIGWRRDDQPHSAMSPTPGIDNVVVGTEDGDDFTLRDGHRYTITTLRLSLRGTFDARRSTSARLRFRGLYADEWFTVDPRDIRDARPA